MRFEVEEEGISTGEFLKKKRFSRRLISRLKFENGIFVNGLPAWTNRVLERGDVVEIRFSEKPSENIVPEDIPLSILYEDEYLLAVNKPKGTAIHPSHGHGSGTLANAVQSYYNKNGIKTAVRIAGRLDLDTTGAVLISKDSLTAKILSETNINKFYIAIVCGKLPRSGVITANIEDLEHDMKRVVSPRGRYAATEYTSVWYGGDFTVARVRLVTGRTHQIRLHMAHIGHPLVGDSLYGSGNYMPRQALHASALEFIHPYTGENICISAPLPDDMKNFILEHRG